MMSESHNPSGPLLSFGVSGISAGLALAQRTATARKNSTATACTTFKRARRVGAAVTTRSETSMAMRILAHQSSASYFPRRPRAV